MSLITKVNALATAIGQDIKGILAGMGLLSALNTTAKDSLVAAINEVNSKPAGGESNTASNLGTVGEGVYASKSGVDLRFKKLNATGAASISSDATTITFTVDELALQTYVDNAQGYALQAADEQAAALNWASEAQTYASQAQAAAAGDVIDDATVAALKAWSSQKVVATLANYAAATHNHDSAYAAATHNHVSAGISDFSEAVDARIQANGPKITVGTTAPSSPAVGDLWVDTN